MYRSDDAWWCLNMVRLYTRKLHVLKTESTTDRNIQVNRINSNAIFHSLYKKKILKTLHFHSVHVELKTCFVCRYLKQSQPWHEDTNQTSFQLTNYIFKNMQIKKIISNYIHIHIYWIKFFLQNLSTFV